MLGTGQDGSVQHVVNTLDGKDYALK